MPSGQFEPINIGKPVARILTPEEKERRRRIGDATRRAESLLEHGRLGEAEEVAEVAVRLSSERRGGLSPATTDLLARIYSQQGRYEEAAALFGFGAAMNLNAAVALIMTGRVAEARKSYKDAHILRYHPDFKRYLPGDANARAIEATIFLGRGIVDYDFRRYGSAAWALEHAVRLVPRNPLALWYFGKALAIRKRTPEARRYLEAAVQRDKGGHIARRARADLAKLGPVH